MSVSDLTLIRPLAGKVNCQVLRRVRIVLLGAISRVAHALPLRERLRHVLPNAHIAWWFEPKFQTVLEGHSWLDELIVYNRPRAPWPFVLFVDSVHTFGFHLVLDLQRHIKNGFVAFVWAARVRVGFDCSNGSNRSHHGWAS